MEVKGQEDREEKKHEPNWYFRLQRHQPVARSENITEQWRIDTVVNPRNDSIQILALPEGELFILPEDITTEERKEYPMRIMTDTLEEKFLNEINRSMIPHIPHNLIENDIEARARLTIMLKMENSEGDI